MGSTEFSEDRIKPVAFTTSFLTGLHFCVVMFYLNVTSNDSAKVGTPISSDRVSVREIPLLLFCFSD